jgi:predicted O-linked N-acetylglucosamine transferase (SPINDLY family)
VTSSEEYPAFFGSNALDSGTKLDYATLIRSAWQGKLDLSQLLDNADSLEKSQKGDLATVLYRTWIERTRSPHLHFACFNLGVLLYGAGDLSGALEAYERAMTLAPEFIHPHFNAGLVYERLGKTDDALSEWRWVAEHARADDPEQRPILISALNNLGRLLESRKQYGEALAYLEKSLLLNPQQSDAIHHWVFIRERMCLWPVHSPLGEVSLDQMRESTSALAMLSLSDDPEEQLAAATSYAQRKIPSNLPRLAPPEGYRHDRIRIGYCSSDFCLHPVSMLTVELFELHDKTELEVFAFCWSPEDGSELRNRIIKSCDHFIQISAINDEEAAKLIRSHEIDILIDLHGQTLGARTTMLAYRPAPIQITYLGLPATTGYPFIDYVIADRFLIPEESSRYYSEKPLYMPDVYQISDRKRLCAPPPTRKSCGLPSNGFVYCSFNNNFKYTPEIFSAWMNILRRTNGSVLWLLSDNPWAEENLKKEAIAQGVDADRLVFSTRTAPASYLARYAIADLFLDTFPFNAGTTANDALWMGLPILTLTGRCFASRMAGALLTAANVPELIAYNIEDYEKKAVALATDTEACQRIRERLEDARNGGVLFDTPRFVSSFEQIMKNIYQQTSLPALD